MEKVLIYENTKAIDECLQRLDEAKPKVQKIVLGVIGCGVFPVISDLQRLLRLFHQNNFNEGQIQDSVEDYLRNEIVKKADIPPVISGIAIDKSAFGAMVELPESSVLDKLSDDFYKYCYSSYCSYNSVDLNHYQIAEDGKLDIAPGVHDKVREMFRVYVHSGKALQTYNVAKTIAANLNELETLKHSDALYYGDKLYLPNAIRFLSIENGKWQVDKNFISNLANQ